jgi:hypothetical protein
MHPNGIAFGFSWSERQQSRRAGEFAKNMATMIGQTICTFRTLSKNISGKDAMEADMQDDPIPQTTPDRPYIGQLRWYTYHATPPITGATLLQQWNGERWEYVPSIQGEPND